MKISTLRKIYPYLNSGTKNIKWRSLNISEISEALEEPQKISSCYCNSVLRALFLSASGSKVLSSRIKIQKGNILDPAFKFKLYVDGKNEVYRVTPKDCYGKYNNIFRLHCERPYKTGNFLDAKAKGFNIAVNIAISKLLKKHPSQKPWYIYLRNFPFYNLICEYNKPSKAFEWFTGIKPYVLNEDGLFKRLKNTPKQARKILEEINSSADNDKSFILLTGLKKVKNINSWHCVSLEKDQAPKNMVAVHDNRTRELHIYSIDGIINNFKAIIGIDWSKLS